MLNFIKESKVYQIIIWLILIIATVLTIYTPDFLYLRFWSRYAVQIMFSLLLLGLIFLMLRDPKSMYVSFICCGLLCYSLRSREPFYAPREMDTMLTMAHITLDQENPQGIVEVIMENQPDVVTFQEYNFIWKEFFSEDSLFNEVYKYKHEYFEFGIHDYVIYSKHQIDGHDFDFEGAPNTLGKIEIDQTPFYFVKVSTTPPVNIAAFKQIGNHLKAVADTIKTLEAPAVVLGNYNVTHYSPEISTLKSRGNLSDSRSDSKLYFPPYDHIFYNRKLVCVGFSTLLDKESEKKIGIMGKYQLNRRQEKKNVKEATR